MSSQVLSKMNSTMEYEAGAMYIFLCIQSTFCMLREKTPALENVGATS